MFYKEKTDSGRGRPPYGGSRLHTNDRKNRRRNTAYVCFSPLSLAFGEPMVLDKKTDA